MEIIMTVTLNEVLNAYGYVSEEERVSMAILAAYTNCFGDKYMGKSICDISDKEAIELLQTPFESLAEGVKWWHKVTDGNWLRKNFKGDRFDPKDPKKDPFEALLRCLSGSEKPEGKEGQRVLKMFKTLGLTKTVEWPAEEPKLVVLHGGLQQHMEDRINFIPGLPDGAKVLIMTNARMLQNWEKSFARFVAEIIFKYTGEKLIAAIPIIQAVLDKNMNFKESDLNWLKNPDGLKQAIVDALGENTWPHWQGAYSRNPEPYELAAIYEGRPSPAGLPAAVDMVEFLLKERQIAEPDKFKNIKVVPVYSVRKGGVSTAENHIEDLIEKYGDELNGTVLFVGNNSLGLHYIDYLQTQTEATLARLEKVYGRKFNIKVITVGKGGDEINFAGALDMLARKTHAQCKHILENLEKPKVREEKLLQRKNPEDLAPHASSAGSDVVSRSLESTRFFSPSQYASKGFPYGTPVDDPVQQGLGLAKK